ncbi:alcohol dehydrogenase catalytic domain-containing protein [bacterium]|nr:alcohol dehydrogenase catalytic domain-containing protein [bacterium]MBU1982923.1 alcohol dehydrogenase catalytic domain-containing protein [bacterium]
MQAIQKQSTAKGLTFLPNAPAPRITRSDEVLIKINAAGICGTDVDIYRSDAPLMKRMEKRLPVIVGHEFCGIVEEVGTDVTGIKTGDYVSAEMHVICGICHNCRTGNGQWCLNTIIRGIDGDGVFADYVVLPARAVIPLPPDLPCEVAAYLDAIGNAVHTVRSVDVTTKDVVILGAGPMGIMATSLCRLMGARRIYVTDVQDSLLHAAKEEGADDVFNVADPKQRTKFVEVCRSDPHKRGVDVVFELSGHAPAYRDAFDVIRMGGEISLLGLARGDITVDFSSEVIFKGLTIRGIIGRKIFETWIETLALLQGPFLNTARKVVTHTFALKDFQKGFDVKLRGEGLKVVLYPQKA